MRRWEEKWRRGGVQDGGREERHTKDNVGIEGDLCLSFCDFYQMVGLIVYAHLLTRDINEVSQLKYNSKVLVQTEFRFLLHFVYLTFKSFKNL